MKKPTDAVLVQEALDLLKDRPADDRVREILLELRNRTTVSAGQRKFQRAWLEGRQARQQGVPFGECPYVEKTERRTFTTAYRNAWGRGWQGLDHVFRQRVLKRSTMRQILCKPRARVTA